MLHQCGLNNLNKALAQLPIELSSIYNGLGSLG